MDKQIEKFEFRVIDNNTGEEADIEEIALTEDWANGLIYCDMEGFAILDDGNLVLLDECGNSAYCPNGRFSVILENAVVLTKAELAQIQSNFFDAGIKHGSKETAEKFAEKLFDFLDDYALFDKRFLERKIDEICKEITEGKV